MWFLFGCVALMLLYSKFVYGIHQTLVVCLPKSNTQYVWLFMYIFGYVISPYARHTTTTKKKQAIWWWTVCFYPNIWSEMETERNKSEWQKLNGVDGYGLANWPMCVQCICVCVCVCLGWNESLKCQVECGAWSGVSECFCLFQIVCSIASRLSTRQKNIFRVHVLRTPMCETVRCVNSFEWIW